MKAKKHLRRRLWEKPERIERFFPDEEWASFVTEERLEGTRSKELLTRIHQQIASKQEIIATKRSVPIYWPGIFAVAATLLPLLVAVTLWKLSLRSVGEDRRSDIELVAADIWRTHVNSSAESIQLILPDSSIIRLFPQSKLRYLRNFSQTTRESFLEGKAVFEVANDPRRPFSVYAGKTKTTALGTIFTVQANEKNNTVKIQLHSGKVQIEATQANQRVSKRILSPGEQFTFDPVMEQRAAKLEKSTVKTAKGSYAKKENVLFFKDLQLKKVLDVLAKEYHTEILIEPQLNIAQISYTGEVDVAEEQLHEVLNKICLLNGFQFTVDESMHYTIQQIVINNTH